MGFARHQVGDAYRMNRLLRVAHVWDVYAGTKRKDLHTELRRRDDVRSRQYVRRLEATSDTLPPETFPFEVIPPGATGRPFLTRLRGRLGGPVSKARYLAFLSRHFRGEPPAVLHAHFGTTGWLVSRTAERLRLPLVVIFYGVDVSQVLRQPGWRRRYAVMFRQASRLVVLCDEARDRLVDLGCPREKVRVWNYPVDVDAYEYRPRLTHTPVRLITAARFVEKKGYPFLLQACAALVRHGRDLTLTAVGYGSLRSEIERQAMSLGLGERFRVIDTSDMDNFDVFYSKILQDHDVFVLASTTAASGDDEGGPALSLVLAQAAGLPVVCTPFVGASRSVIDMQTGLFCRQDDPASLEERIAYLVDRRDLWNQLGVAGSGLVRSRFSFDRQVDEMVAIYREAVSVATR